MGSTSWSSVDYTARSLHREKTGKTAFTYDADSKASGVLKVHETLDPKKLNSKGLRIREGLDSKEHPESLAIAVFLDVTGSMRNVPVIAQKKLGQLMSVLLGKGYVEHPHILFGAIGDANSDYVPLQIGQFEQGIELDDQLTKLILEGNGGSQIHETYELAHYFMARHSVIDCWDKRNKKGYFFSIGDEFPYNTIKKNQVLEIIGDELEGDIPTEQIFKELQERYEVFHIIPTQTSNGKNPEIKKLWKEHFDERVLLLDNADAICETIAMTIAWNEGVIDDTNQAAKDLIEVGADKKSVVSATNAIIPYISVTQALKKASGASNLPACKLGDIGRL